MFTTLLKNKEKIYSFFVYLIVFLSSVFPAGDKDWGWHYKYGEYFLKNGKILTSDIFSWTMQGYQWINHSWAYDPLLYILTNLTGYVGLALIGALINLLTFYFLIANFKLDYWKKAILAVPFILISEVGIMFGLRSQVVSTLFFAILMFLLIRARTRLKSIFFLPLLFLIWANFHGDFTLGLLIVGVFLGSYFLIDFYKTKKFNSQIFWKYGLVSAICFAVTFINPFGYHVYLESIRHFSNPYLKNVYEWMPIYNNCSYCHVSSFIIYALALIACFGFYIMRKKLFTIPFLILAIMLIWPTIDTRRFLPIFVVVTLPFLAGFIQNIKLDLSKYKILPLITIVVILISLEFNLYNRFTNYKLYNFTENDFCHFASECSTKTIDYLVSHPPKGKGFTFYDIGGYLIGKNIPVKLFIDGRMHLWKDDASGYTAFGDYIKMYYGPNIKLFNKYDFDWLFIQKSSTIMKEIYATKNLGRWNIEYQDNDLIYLTRIRQQNQLKPTFLKR